METDKWGKVQFQHRHKQLKVLEVSTALAVLKFICLCITLTNELTFTL